MNTIKNVDELYKKTVLITGASGLIGKKVVEELLNLYDDKIRLILLVRNRKKLGGNIQYRINDGNIKCVEGSITDKIEITEKVDYIIHGASITESKKMIENPVEVINTNVIGTKNILEFARQKNVKSVIYLSSMEVYGFTTEEHLLREKDVKYLNPLEVRSSYPESKRMCECMCVAYEKEYGIPVKIIRLAQTFGKGVSKDDKRAFAEFARCALEGKNIELLTNGMSKRVYLDVSDAVKAIITVLLNGEVGKAYNAANRNTYCSIYEMAMLVRSKIAANAIEVIILDDSSKSKKYPPAHKLYLDTSEIEKLGWKATNDLEHMYRNMIAHWENENAQI